MEKAGVVNHGPFDFAGNKSTVVQEYMPFAEILWIETEHLRRFGAALWSRERFLDALTRSLRKPLRRGAWRLERP